jgi:hypothetical protein
MNITLTGILRKVGQRWKLQVIEPSANARVLENRVVDLIETPEVEIEADPKRAARYKVVQRYRTFNTTWLGRPVRVDGLVMAGPSRRRRIRVHVFGISRMPGLEVEE